MYIHMKTKKEYFKSRGHHLLHESGIKLVQWI